MLDAFIIDRLKKERERQQEEWQPVPLPLEEYPQWKDDAPPKKDQDENRNAVIVFHF